MVLIYQPPNAHVRISGILPSNGRNGNGGREKDLIDLVVDLIFVQMTTLYYGFFLPNTWQCPNAAES
jgi:hypothetical protein